MGKPLTFILDSSTATNKQSLLLDGKNVNCVKNAALDGGFALMVAFDVHTAFRFQLQIFSFILTSLLFAKNLNQSKICQLRITNWIEARFTRNQINKSCVASGRCFILIIALFHINSSHLSYHITKSIRALLTAARNRYCVIIFHSHSIPAVR